MPKRVHCPYCDRLFSRDKIDEHIRRCRARTESKRNYRANHTTELIVDGNNVAYYLTVGNQPRVRNLINARRSLLSAGYQPTIVVSAALKYRIDKPEVLRELITAGKIAETTRGQNDDLVIIQLAKKRKAYILTNDRFLDWRERFPWLGESLLRYRMTPTGLIIVE